MSDEMKNQGSQPKRDIDYDESNNVSRIHEQIEREQADPDQGAEPIPMAGIAIVMVILALGFMYFGMFSAGFKGDGYDERGGSAASTADAGAAVEEDPMAILLKNGKRVFQANCQACHQASGGGVPGQYPPLVGSRWVLENDERLIALVLGGLQGPIEVKGSVYNSVMVGWAPTLSDAQIAGVVTFIRQEWGNAGVPVSPEAVGKVRGEQSGRTDAWTAAELEQVFGK